MDDFVKVATLAEIPEQSGKGVQVNGKAVALFNLGGTIFAVDDTCPHAEASLAEGDLSGEEVACPLHFATFNVKTGVCTGPPADEDLATYPVKIVNGDEVHVQA